jgi:hypothetical protein
MEYLTLTQDEMDMVYAENLRAREVEHFHYELNRQSYENLLNTAEMKALPEEWPDEIARMRKMGRDELAAAINDPVQLQLAMNLQLRDKLRHDMKTTMVEVARVEKYHSELKAKLPKQKAALDALLLKEKTAREAREAKV